MTEFEIDGKSFRLGKLSIFQQLHVSRKISPLVPPLVPIMMAMAKDKKSESKPTDDFMMLATLAQPFANGLAGMKDEEAEYVFSTCLSIVKYHHEGSFVPLMAQGGKVCMFPDVGNDVSIILRLVVRVIADSLGPFIQGLLTSQQT